MSDNIVKLTWSLYPRERIPLLDLDIFWQCMTGFFLALPDIQLNLQGSHRPEKSRRAAMSGHSFTYLTKRGTKIQSDTAPRMFRKGREVYYFCREVF